MIKAACFVCSIEGETRAFYDKISGIYDLLSERSEGPVRQAGLDKLAPHRGIVSSKSDTVPDIAWCNWRRPLDPKARYLAWICRKECGLGRESESRKST